MKDFIVVFITAVVVILVINLETDKDDSISNNNDEKRWERIASVLDHAFDEFGLFNFQVTPDSTIFIEMDETKSEVQLKKYLEENVSKNDLSQYNIDITEFPNGKALAFRLGMKVRSDKGVPTTVL